MAMKLDFSLIKKHPVATGAIVIGGGVVLFLLMGGGGGGSASAATVSGPSAADVQLATLQYQTDAASAAQASQQSFQLAYLQQQQAGDNNQATMAYNLQMYQAQSGAQLQTLGLQVQEDLTKYTTDASAASQSSAQGYQLAAQANANQNTLDLATLQTGANIQMATLQAQQNEFSVQTNAQLQQALATTSASVSIAQINAQASASKHNSNNSLLGSIGSSLIAAFL